MIQVMGDENKKIHPHKFTLWVAIGSMLMMFAGLTSAYIVKRSQANWLMLDIPMTFWYSTAVILVSSATAHLSLLAIRQEKMTAYKNWLRFTAVLGVLFLLLQVYSFVLIEAKDIRTIGAGSNASYSFLLAISGVHGLHVLGGVIALVNLAIRAGRTAGKTISADSVDIVATYWHFVDLLWIYLFIFFSWMK